MTKGRKREHYQWNVDIIGDNSTLAEAEVLGTAVNALKLLGFSSFDIKVHISSRKLLAKLLNDTGIPESKHQCIFLALDKRRKMPDEELAKMMKENELSDEEINKVFSIMSTTDYSSCPELIELFHYAKLMKFDDFLQFDISVIRGLSYYTGIVFEAFDVKKEFRAVFGGGRYDNLLDTIGG